jgi:hypothetical protein
MRTKQIAILILTSLVSISAVYAAKPLIGMPEVLTKALKFLFVDLMHLSSSDVGVAYMKMILWIILSIFIYLGLDKGGLFGARKGLCAFAAALISIVGVIMIPSKWITGIFSIHATITGAAAGLAPVVFGFWVNHSWITGTTVFHRIMRALIYFAIAGITYALIVVISEGF